MNGGKATEWPVARGNCRQQLQYQRLQLQQQGIKDAFGVVNVLHGWNAYASAGNTYSVRRELEEFVVSGLTHSSAECR